MRTRHSLSRVLAAVTTAATFTLAGCGGGGGDPTGNTPAISLSLGSSTVSVVQGASGTVGVTVGRSGGFAGGVDLSATPASGVTASLAPASLAAGVSASTLTVTAPAATAPGNYQVTVRATGQGVTEKTATLTVTVTAPPSAGGFALTASSAALTVPAGANATTTINIARTAPFAGAVDFTATTSNPGLTATFAPASTTGASSTLTVSAAAGLAVGSYTVTVNGAGSGVAAQSTQIAVTVTASQPSNVTFAFCAGRTPAWLAYQTAPNGTWTRVTTAGPSYTMPINDRGGVAFVLPRTGGGFETSVYYGTAAELSALGQGICGVVATGTKTLFGSVSGVTTADVAHVLFGFSSGHVLSPTAPTYSMFNVADGAYDLLAVRRTLNAQNTRDVSKIIVRRNFNPPSMSTVPALDFEGAEARTPASADLTIQGLNGEAAFVTTGIVTSRGFIGTIPFDFNAASTATTQRYFGLATDQREAGDLHIINAFASTQQGTGRTVTGYFTDIVNRTLGLGPVIGTTTVTATTTPFVRPRVQIASQAEYDDLLAFDLQQGTGAEARALEIVATAGYFGGTAPATWDLSLPDFAGTSYDATWALRTGTVATGTTSASGIVQGSLGIPGSPIPANTVVRNGSRNVSLTP